MSDHRPPRVLCVDDEPFVLTAMQRLLRSRFSLAVARNAVEALVLLEQEGPFDAVVSDLSMPGMDGIELLTRIADAYPQCLRILLTGYGAAALRERGIADGIIEYCLTKPFPPDQLAALIAQAQEKPSIVTAFTHHVSVYH